VQRIKALTAVRRISSLLSPFAMRRTGVHWLHVRGFSRVECQALVVTGAQAQPLRGRIRAASRKSQRTKSRGMQLRVNLVTQSIV
jgi:hypothetical protein